MKAAIAWVKSHLHIVISGALAVLGIVMLVAGYMDKSVSAKLQEDVGSISQLNTLSAVNPDIIQNAKLELNETREIVSRMREQVENIGSHEPLLDDVFPTNRDTSSLLDFKTELNNMYNRVLLDRLQAGDQPTAEEIEKKAREMEAAKELLKLQLEFGEKTESKSESGSSGPGGGPTIFQGFGNNPSQLLNNSSNKEDLTPEERVQENASARASVERARSIRCYANSESFDPQPAVTESSMPNITDLWVAQMSLWIQEDMINAIARLNEQKAQQLQQAGQDPWVGNMPIKHLRSIVINGYAQGSEGSPAGGRGSMGEGQGSFTGRGTTPAVDVLHFEMELVIDASMLPAVIDELSAAGFYTVLLANYREVEANADLTGYIYGSQPAIQLTLKMEGALLRDKYEDLIPEPVKEMIESGTIYDLRKERKGSQGGGSRQNPNRFRQPPPPPPSGGNIAS